ncbi:SpaA isopeptide-forming pilin-related protein [uncultured Vagococcus sp.]|uniref:SpaA isopeptide-forming pilin-related protein n=1 Tax=uncultured Vagococcus sp. TaxID=189676 RepID=UPI0028D4EC7C|nr:SpaA isopeptide-forming pilin-related protein [uncultured Vagococcus sp.]
MKKTIPIIALIVLLLQSVLVPVVAVAESINDGPVASLELSQLKGVLVDDNQREVNQERPLKKDQTYWLSLNGNLEKNVKESEIIDLSVSSNIHINGTTSPLINSDSQEIGEVIVKGQQLQIKLLPDVVGSQQFELRVPVSYHGEEELRDQLIITSQLGETSIEFPLFQGEIKESSESTLEISSSTESSTSSQEKEVPVKKSERIQSSNQIIGNIFDSVELVVTPDPLKPTLTSQINVKYHWSLTDEQQQALKKGDTYTFQLPPELKVTAAAIDKELTNADGEVVATYTVTTDGKVVFTFTEAAENLENISGDFWFTTRFNEKVITTPEDLEIVFPIKDKDLQIKVPIYTEAEESIDKRGKLDKALNPTKVTWDVFVNKTKAERTALKVKEELPAGLTVTEIKVYEIAVNFEGEVTNENLAEIPATDYEVVGTDVIFKGTSRKAYRITYETSINEEVKPDKGGPLKLVNHVTSTASDGSELKAEATVTGQYGKVLEKDKPIYRPADLSFDWTVKYNYGEKTIKASDAFLADNFSDNLILVDSSVLLHQMVAQPDGTYKTGAKLIVGEDYILVPVGNGFRVNFLKEVKNAINMTYTTKIKDGLVIDDTQQTVSNKIQTVGGIESGTSGMTTKQGLIKRYAGVDYDKETLSWAMTVNNNNYQMQDWELTDSFTNKGLTFMPETFVMKEKDGRTLVQDIDYELVNKSKEGFSVKLIGAGYQTTTKAFTIDYQTAFDKKELIGENLPYINRAVATWIDKTGDKKTNTSEDKFTPKKESYVNGSKDGSYNAVSKEITWILNTNFNRDTIKNGRIVDPIRGNQQYVPNSAKLYSYTVSSDGEIKDLKEITPIDIIVQKNEEVKTLIVNLPENSKNTGYQLVFKTTLADQIVEAEESYENTATLEEDGVVKDTITGSVSIKNGGTFASKGGRQDPNNPDVLSWDILVNPSQSTLSNFMVKDYPSVNQQLNPESLKIVELVSDENGEFSLTDTVLAKGSDYQVLVTRDDATGEEIMTISFNHKITKAYRISYTADLMLAKGEKAVSNHVSISGDNVKVVTQDKTSTIQVETSEGGGTGSGEKLNFYLKKTDNRGNPLKGITFEILNSKTRKLMRTVTSDANGLVYVQNMLTGTYLLREVAQQNGYMLSTELRDGKVITVSKANADVAHALIVTNQLNQVSLIKQDAKGKALAGAVFSLSMKDAQGHYQKVLEHQSVTSTIKGEVLIEGLLTGSYRLTEVSPAPGYIKNTETVDFTITSQETAKISLGNYINYQGIVEFRKTDNQGKGLQGARFNVLDRDLKVVKVVTSNKDGLVTIELAPGHYTIVEIEAPSGYLLNQTPKRVEIKGTATGKPEIITLDALENYQGSVELEKVSVLKLPLKDAEFSLFKKDGTGIKSGLVTDSNGKLVVNGLASGDYYFQETKAPTGYLLNTDKYDFTISKEARTEPAVVKTRQAINYQGTARLIKLNEAGERLGKAEFKVVKANGELVKTGIVANQDGEVLIQNLAPGDYFFEELKAPKGYVINRQQVAFTIADASLGEPVEVTAGTLTNYQSKAQLIKKDALGNPIAGAVFKVIDQQGKTIAESLSSNANGVVEVTGLVAGEYAFVETKSPGFMLNETPQSFTIQSGYEGTPIVEQAGELINYQGSVELRKTDDRETPLEGAEFTLYKDSGELIAGGLVTNSQGNLLVKALAPGKYYFEESKAPMGYLINTKKITFNIQQSAQTQLDPVEVRAINYQGVASLIKEDESGQPLSGAVFKVVSKDKKGEDGLDLVIREGLQSAENGLVSVTGLAPGQYGFVETKAPAGYILNTLEKEFTIDASAEGQPEIVKAGNLKNYQGKFSFRKVNGSQVPSSATYGLKGAEFEMSYINRGKVDKRVLTADSAGVVNLTGLAPGHYEIKEIKAPKGFITRTKTFEFEVAVENNGIPASVFAGSGSDLFENYQGTAELTKRAANGQGLAGAIFSVLDSQGHEIQTGLLSDSKGVVRAVDLAPGSYAFVETQAPAGYVLNKDEVPFIISETSDSGRVDVTGLELTNYQGSVALTKQNSVGEKLAQAEFSLYKQNKAEDTLVAKELVSNEQGLIRVRELSPGTYYFKETKAPVGYLINGEKISFSIAKEASQVPETLTVTATNYQGSAALVKVDEVGRTLADAEFSVLTIDGKVIQSGLVSNDEGLVRVNKLAPGTYFFAETKAAPGHLLNDERLPFTIVNETIGEPALVMAGNFANYQGRAQLSKVDQKGQGLAGAVFKVINENQQTIVENLVSNQEGIVKVANLAPGNYAFVETKAVKGYMLNETAIPFKIANNAFKGPLEVFGGQLINYQGRVELAKVNQRNKPLEKAIFNLYREDGTLAAKDLITNQAGKIQVTDLAPGNYYFSEQVAPKGYLLNTEKVWFTISDQASEAPEEVNVKATNYQGAAQLKKVDKEGNELAGAHFRLLDSQGNEIRQKLETNNQGLVVATDLSPGTYFFEETQAPKGYLINSNKIKVEVAESHEGQPEVVQGTNLVNYQGSAQLEKVTEAGQPLGGAVFKVINRDAEDALVVEGLVSDEKGLVTVEGLAPGNYAFVETEAPRGYILNTKAIPVTISNQAQGEPVVFNAGQLINYQGTISFKKVSGNEKTRVLKDAIFKLSKVDGQTRELVNDHVVTARNSDSIVLTGLAPGHYVLEETLAPAGFIKRLEPIEFEIGSRAENRPENAYRLNKELVFENYQGTAELIKSNQEGEGLQGAVFNLVDGQGQVIQKELTSDSEGRVKAENLAPGTYYFLETKAPSGYLINTEKVTFTIEGESQDGHADINNLRLINYQGSVSLKKVDDQEKVLAGAEFSLYLQNKGKDTLIAKELVSDAQGMITVTDLAPGIYYFKETKAPVGYVLSANKFTFTIATENSQKPESVTVDAVNLQGSVILTKKATGTMKSLEGAEFTLVTAAGEVVNQELITDANGRIMVKNLAPGDYAFIETKAPTGYRLDSKPAAFKIKAEAEEVVKENHLSAVQVTKYNEPIKPVTPISSKKGRGDLPQAGNQSDLFATVIGAGIVGGIVMVRRKRKTV